jgi:hypothetical protein
MVLTKDPLIAKGKAAAEKALENNFIKSPPVIIHELVENYGLTVFKATNVSQSLIGFRRMNSRG